MSEPVTDEQIFNHMISEFEAMFSIDNNEPEQEENDADE